MDIHAPESPIRSVKDFLVHLGTVTVGILIALGLEQIVEARHRAHLAAQAVEGFRTELGQNREAIEAVLAAMPGLRKTIDTELAALATPATPPRRIVFPDIDMDLVADASWQSAVATQALNEIDETTLRRYAVAYGVDRLFLQQEEAMLGEWEGLRNFGDDPAKLLPAQLQALAERFRHYESYSYALEFIGKGAIKSSDEALR
jgi:hypothetical protein